MIRRLGPEDVGKCCRYGVPDNILIVWRLKTWWLRPAQNPMSPSSPALREC